MPEKEPIEFALLDNALDYLKSAADLWSEETPRGWKYALVHLVSGIELLVKARLNVEHWTLLFSNVDNADRAALDKGDFVSVDFKAAIERLVNIAGLDLSKTDRVRLNDLRRYRNQVVHFGFRVDRNIIVPLLAYGYHFCLGLIREQLSGELDETQSASVDEMNRQLVEWDDFVRVHEEELQPRLREAYVLIDCPRCWRRALELGAGAARCLFCGHTSDPDELVDEVDVFEGPEACPECGGPCVSIYDDHGSLPPWVCLKCGEHGNYETCAHCGSLFSGEALPGDRCPDCWKALIEKD